MYTPKPVDTSDVVIPEELMQLVEQMSAHVHDIWAKGRIQEGWTYAPEKSNTEKTNPCLVPYDELSESEKEYDRNTCMETLKLILKLGFHISK